MTKFTSGERRGTILLVVIIALIIGGMLYFKNGDTHCPIAQTDRSATETTTPELPDTTGPSIKKETRKGRKKKSKSDSTTVKSPKKNRQSQSGNQRNYLDEKVNTGE